MSDTFDETAFDEPPAPLPADMLSPSERPSRLEDDLPLHLRVARAILEAQPSQERIEEALALANEVYELETED